MLRQTAAIQRMGEVVLSLHLLEDPPQGYQANQSARRLDLPSGAIF